MVEESRRSFDDRLIDTGIARIPFFVALRTIYNRYIYIYTARSTTERNWIETFDSVKNRPRRCVFLSFFRASVTFHRFPRVPPDFCRRWSSKARWKPGGGRASFELLLTRPDVLALITNGRQARRTETSTCASYSPRQQFPTFPFLIIRFFFFPLATWISSTRTASSVGEIEGGESVRTRRRGKEK